MGNIRLQQHRNDPQYFCTKDGQKSMKEGNTRLSEEMFIRNLIRSNAEYSTEGCVLFVSDLELEDQKLLLSYTISADEYEWAQKNPTRFTQVLREYQKDMQLAINQHTSDVWHEDMKEMGMKLCHHKDNGECFYV